jgi:hypothetical protein
VNFYDFDKRHIELVESVNNSRTQAEHDERKIYLRGFRETAKMFVNIDWCACDMHYINQGIDRPMVAGVFLDWQPASEAKEQGNE